MDFSSSEIRGLDQAAAGDLRAELRDGSKVLLGSIRNWLLNGLLLFTGVSLSLVLCEVLLRLFLPAPPVTNTPKEFLARNGAGYLPNSMWSVIEPEFHQSVRINSLGYRDQEMVPGLPTLVFLGDSQTFGTGVNFGERASDIVREPIKHHCGERGDVWQVLNVAMPGASTYDEYRLLVDILKKGINVAHVFVLITTNDHYANLRDELDPTDSRTNNQRTTSGFHDWIKRNRYRSRLVHLTISRLAASPWFQKLYASFRADLGLGEFVAVKQIYTSERAAASQFAATERALRRIRDIRPMSMVLIPDRYRFDPVLIDTSKSELVGNSPTGEPVLMTRESVKMRDFATILGVDFIDPNSRFALAENSDRLAFPINGHLTVSGQRLLAEVILSDSELLGSLCNTGDREK